MNYVNVCACVCDLSCSGYADEIVLLLLLLCVWVCGGRFRYGSHRHTHIRHSVAH